jgi:hypothetical protein
MYLLRGCVSLWSRWGTAHQGSCITALLRELRGSAGAPLTKAVVFTTGSWSAEAQAGDRGALRLRPVVERWGSGRLW